MSQMKIYLATVAESALIDPAPANESMVYTITYRDDNGLIRRVENATPAPWGRPDPDLYDAAPLVVGEKLLYVLDPSTMRGFLIKTPGESIAADECVG